MNKNKNSSGILGRNFTGKTRNALSTGYSTTKNATLSSYNSFRTLSAITQVLLVLIVVVVIVLLVLWIRSLYQTSQKKAKESPYIIRSPVNAFNQNDTPIVTKRVPTPVDSAAFSFSFWIYIADWNYKFGQWKNILLKGQDDYRCPGIWLYPKTNSLHARVSTFADLNEGCDIRNIPLQKWVHIVYVLNNRSTDIYIDGKLERSCVLRGVPKINQDPVTVCNDGGFFGQIAKMQYFVRALLPTEVSEIYSEGPYLSKGFELNFSSIFGSGYKESEKNEEYDKNLAANAASKSSDNDSD